MGQAAVHTASPATGLRRFRGGAHRVVQVVDTALEYGVPVHARHETAPDEYVVPALEKKSVTFVDETAEAPEGSIVVFLAQVVTPAVHDETAEPKLVATDPTCPSVNKVHEKAARFAKEYCGTLTTGHEGHGKGIGTPGEAPGRGTPVGGPGDAAGTTVPGPEGSAVSGARVGGALEWPAQRALEDVETMERDEESRYFALPRGVADISRAEQRQPVLSQPSVFPRHLGVIPDGNRRWARAHGVSSIEAYREGAGKVGELMDWCDNEGIGWVTVWALSTLNLSRPTPVVSALVTVITDGLRAMAETRKWRIRPIGALDLLPQQQADRLRDIARDTADAHGATLNAAVVYEGREEIVAAVRRLIVDMQTGVAPAAVTEDLIAAHLTTAGQPDLDLVIRTSGEQRLSGFMPWQATQAELYFTPTLWPDFTKRQFDEALHWYSHRQRRFGR
ncbi:polyprenyl diphosphate synthase [Streptomyces sp. NPDC002537]